MKCPSCGASLEGASTSCPSCGSAWSGDWYGRDENAAAERDRHLVMGNYQMVLSRRDMKSFMLLLGAVLSSALIAIVLLFFLG